MELTPRGRCVQAGWSSRLPRKGSSSGAPSLNRHREAPLPDLGGSAVATWRRRDAKRRRNMFTQERWRLSAEKAPDMPYQKWVHGWSSFTGDKSCLEIWWVMQFRFEVWGQKHVWIFDQRGLMMTPFYLCYVKWLLDNAGADKLCNNKQTNWCPFYHIKVGNLARNRVNSFNCEKTILLILFLTVL